MTGHKIESVEGGFRVVGPLLPANGYPPVFLSFSAAMECAAKYDRILGVCNADAERAATYADAYAAERKAQADFIRLDKAVFYAAPFSSEATK